MVQFNLLPDVKIQYLRARRQEHLVVLVSTFATIAGIAVVLILLSTVYVVQKKNLSDLDRDIKTDSQQLQATPNLDKILTVQNQLTALPSLHDQKPVATRLAGFLSQLTPSAANISKLDVDFTQNTISIGGTANTLSTVTTFADTLKLTTYAVKSTGVSGKSAFSNVVLSQYSLDKQGATYTLTASFDPTIFSEESDVGLIVPSSLIPARSAVANPTQLFNGSNSSSTSGGQ